MKKRSLKPRKKVAAAGVGGAAATALIGLAQAFGVDLDPATAGALVTLASFAAGWLKKEEHPGG